MIIKSHLSIINLLIFYKNQLNEITFFIDSDGLEDCVYMSPMDTQQYLYCLTPKPEVYANPKLLKDITNIGKLDIVWKTNMGESGRLQTSPLQRVVSVIFSF